jgi:hypothetical protein
MRLCTLTPALICATFISLLCGNVSAQQSIAQNIDAGPCFKQIDKAVFDTAEKEVIKTIVLGANPRSGPVWVQAGTKMDPRFPSNRTFIYLATLRGAATYADTRPGLVLKCVFTPDGGGAAFTRYYTSLDSFDKTNKGDVDSKDGAFVIFPMSESSLLHSVEITALTLPTAGKRIKYTGSMRW